MLTGSIVNQLRGCVGHPRRGLSQGWVAAVASSCGAALGIMVHSIAATLGLVLVLQASPWAFWAIEMVARPICCALDTRPSCRIS